MACVGQLNDVLVDAKVIEGFSERISELESLIEQLQDRPETPTCVADLKFQVPLDDTCQEIIGDFLTYDGELRVLGPQLQKALDNSFDHLQELLECAKADAEGKPFPPGQEI